MLWGFEKGRGEIGQNALTVTLFKQLPPAQIGPKFKNFCVYQKANDQTIILSPENVQKVHSRPRLLAFEKKFPRNGALNEGCPLWTAATGTNFDKIKKFWRPSDRDLPGDYFGLCNFWKWSFLAWVTDNQSLVTNRGTFCPVFTPFRHFFWLSLLSLPVCTFFDHFLSNPPSKIRSGGTEAQQGYSIAKQC